MDIILEKKVSVAQGKVFALLFGTMLKMSAQLKEN